MKVIFVQSNVKAFAILNCEDLEFSLKGVSMVAWQSSMSRHGNTSCCNSAIKCPICPKLHRFDKSPGLNTSKGQYCIIIIAPPAGNRKWLILHYINMQCPICTKLHMFGKRHGLKTPKGQYSVIIIAPPVDNRIRHGFILTQTYYVQSAPNFICLINMLAWTHLKANIPL